MTDSERIDWLEQMANLPGGLHLHDGSHSGCVGLGLRPGYVRRTLREAIDQACPSSELNRVAGSATAPK